MGGLILTAHPTAGTKVLCLKSELCPLGYTAVRRKTGV